MHQCVPITFPVTGWSVPYWFCTPLSDNMHWWNGIHNLQVRQACFSTYIPQLYFAVMISHVVFWCVFFFFFFSCIRGRLLEVNENILETPNLLLEKVNVYFYTLCTSEYHVYVCPPVNIDYWLFMFACSYIWLKFTFIMIFVSFSTIIISVKSSNLIKRNAWNVIIVLHQSEQPSTEGYIAVILPKFEESKSITENLLSREEFESIVAKRTVDQSQPTWRSSMFLS